MKKFIIIFIVISVMLSGVVAYLQLQRVPMTYELTTEGYKLTRYMGISTEKSITVPDTWEGEKVRSLGAFAISNCDYLEVINIGQYMTDIDVFGITNNKYLKEINVDPLNPKYSSLDGVLFNKDQSVLLVYPNYKGLDQAEEKALKKALKSTYTVPNTVTKINENAFYRCRSLETVNLPTGLTIISDRAFHNAWGLTSITIPDTVTYIGRDAFSYCQAVASAIFIPKSVTFIGDWAFFGSEYVTEIKVELNESEFSKVALGKSWSPYIAKTFKSPVIIKFGQVRG